MKILERLDISQNVLSGTLPHLWGLMSLVNLNLSGNTLSGQPFPCMAASFHCHNTGTWETLLCGYSAAEARAHGQRNAIL